MASFTYVGLDDLMLSYEQLAEIPDSVIDDMLNSEADVIAKAQKRVGLRMGVFRKRGDRPGGMTLSSIKKTEKVKATAAGGRYLDVYPQGKNADGNDNAEVAFVNEYGKDGQEARPFMRTANEEASGEAAEKAATVHDNWLKSHNL